MFGKSPSHNRPTNQKSGVFSDLSRLLLCIAMNEEPNGTMLSLVSSALRCRVTEKLTVRMPRVVSDQRAKFENDELFRKLSRESEVRYTGFRDRPHDERQLRFHTECREGHADVAFTATGTNLQLSFAANAWSDKPEDRTPTQEFVNFDREPGKVHLKSQFIMNGVCVVWRGWIDLQRLDGIGCLEFDDDRAEVEDAILREQIDQYNRRLREFEERQRQYRQDQERQAESEAEERQMLVRPQTGDYFQTPSSQNGFPRHRTQRSEKDFRIHTKQIQTCLAITMPTGTVEVDTDDLLLPSRQQDRGSNPSPSETSSSD